MGVSNSPARLSRFAVIAAAALAMVAGSIATAEARQGDDVGAPGIGDSYYPRYGNGGYDVKSYDVRLQYDPGTGRLWGTTTILAKATQDLSRFNLDFALDVTSVSVNGWTAGHAKAYEHELVVTPARRVASGQPLSIVVRYDDLPSQVKIDGYTGWRTTADGALAIGQPRVSNWWFPGNDHPLDKATYDISIGVPDGLEVISNGVQPVAPTGYRPGWTRWSWRSTKPMQTYLAFVAIGQYEIVNDTAPDGRPIVNAYSLSMGETGPAARASIEQTAQIAQWAVGVFGEYPFEAYGGVGAPDGAIGFALENQTRPVYGMAHFRAGSNPYVVVHEVAHQWYGDSVALSDWRHIWLHEGFATYAQWLYSEHIGEGTAQELFDFTYHQVPPDDPFWQVRPGDPGVAPNLFHAAVYRRGAMTLHQLRLAMGDAPFFTLLRRWAKVKQYGTASVAEFEALAEQVSGRELSELFQLWLYTPGRPELAAAAAGAEGPVAEPKSARRMVYEELHADH